MFGGTVFLIEDKLVALRQPPYTHLAIFTSTGKDAWVSKSTKKHPLSPPSLMRLNSILCVFLIFVSTS